MEEKEQVLIKATKRRYIFGKIVLFASCGYIVYRIIARLLLGLHFSGGELLLLIAELFFFDFAALTLIWLFLLGRRPSLIVTNRRVCGKTAFGKRVDLPIDMISSVGMRAIGRRIWIATASGRTHFRKLRNYNEIFQTISDKLAERQNRPDAPAQDFHLESAEGSLRAAKRLLDDGLLSPDEYESIKKRVLPL